LASQWKALFPLAGAIAVTWLIVWAVYFRFGTHRPVSTRFMVGRDRLVGNLWSIVGIGATLGTLSLLVASFFV